jgi:predicted ArsR family transcriptional regulator
VLVADQMRMGFDPEVVDADERTTVAFTHCPFRELAEGHPELVCSMHCGMVEGLVDELGGARVVRFHSLVDREPCQVELAAI